MAIEQKPFGTGFPAWPEVDYSQFGEVEVLAVPRVQRFVSGVMARNWATIPHVTHNEEVDITSLDDARKQLSIEFPGLKITPLIFFIKAVVKALQEYPVFNTSLDASGVNLTQRKFFNVGVAVDTPNGLLVPVLRDCDKKTIPELAGELAELTSRARDKGLPMADMQGGCFTISSLGGIGGTSFSPIINAPEVAILGVTKAQWRPQRAPGDGIEWRSMLPLSLSYDHRVINGADAARFCVAIGQALSDPLRIQDR